MSETGIAFWLIVFALIGLLVFMVRRSGKTSRKAESAAMTAYVGSEPDFLWRGKQLHHVNALHFFAAWIAQGKIYASYMGEFDQKYLFGIDDVRAVKIEWDTIENNRGLTVKAGYMIAIELRSIERSLIKIDAEDEATAHKIQEVLRQMAETTKISAAN